MRTALPIRGQPIELMSVLRSHNIGSLQKRWLGPVMTTDKISVADRTLAGLELAGRILFWLIMFVPCTVWFLLALAFDALKRPQAGRPGSNDI